MLFGPTPSATPVQCSTNCDLKPKRWDQVNLLRSCVSLKDSMNEMNAYFKCGSSTKERADPLVETSGFIRGRLP